MVRSPPRVKVPDAWAGACVVTSPTVRAPAKTGHVRVASCPGGLAPPCSPALPLPLAPPPKPATSAWEAVPVDLHTIAQLPFPYPEVGATAGPPPPGYKH